MPVRRRALWLAFGAAALGVTTAAAATGWRQLVRRDGRPAAEQVFALVGAGAYRPLDARLSHPLADRHRPLARVTSGDSRTLLPNVLLAGMERDGDHHGVAVAYLLAGEVGQARARLEKLAATGASPAIESDLAALDVADERRQGDALERIERALRVSPDHSQAHWNTALILESLGLPLGAAESFRAVAVRAEPGWAAEAARRAGAIASDYKARREAYRRAEEHGLRLALDGELPPPDVVEKFPDVVRENLYRAVRAAPTSARVEALAGLAAALDAHYGGAVLAHYVHRTARADFAARAPRALRYRELIQKKLGDEAEIKPYLTHFRYPASGDILLGALYLAPRSKPYADEHGRLAATAGDPFQALIDDSVQARTFYAEGAYDKARVRAEAAIARCDRTRMPSRCVALRMLLGSVHEAQHRLQSGRRPLLEALGIIKASGLHGEWESHVHTVLGSLENMRYAFPLARAYLGEVTLASGSCRAAQNARQVLAQIAMAEADPDTAWRRLSEVGRCEDGWPRFDLPGLEVLAELGRDPGRGEEPFGLLRESLEGLRSRRPLLGGSRALAADVFEGASLALRDRRRPPPF